MGGIGKSVLAAALARDPQVQVAFPDGVIWLALGREPNLTARQEDLYLLLTGERENFSDPARGGSSWPRPCRRRPAWSSWMTCGNWSTPKPSRCAWRGAGASSSPPATANCCRPCRRSPSRWTCSLPTRPCTCWPIGPGRRSRRCPKPFSRWQRNAATCRWRWRWWGAFVRQNLESWEGALHRLQKADLDKLRRLFPGYEHPTLLAALEVSVAALAVGRGARYLDLAVFPEEEAIPLDVLRACRCRWGWTKTMWPTWPRPLSAAPRRGWEKKGQSLRLHDLQHDYLAPRRRTPCPTCTAASCWPVPAACCRWKARPWTACPGSGCPPPAPSMGSPGPSPAGSRGVGGPLPPAHRL